MASPNLHVWCFRRLSESLSDTGKELYDKYPQLFTMKVHHGGYFTEPPKRHYFRGLEIYVDMLDVEDLSMQLLEQIMKELEYEEPKYNRLYFKRPNADFLTGLVELSTDEDVANIRQYVDGHTVIEVYIEKVELNTLRLVSPEYVRSRPGLSKTKPSSSRSLKFG